MEKDFKIIVADTNWWISLVIKNYNNKFAKILLLPNLSFVTSSVLNDEIKSTLSKERLKKYLADNSIEIFWNQFNALVTEIEVKSIITVCRDPKDNFLLALAKDSAADFLVTGDKDLLVIEKFENTIICTLTDLLEKHLNK
jgi:uncharacterized protein